MNEVNPPKVRSGGARAKNQTQERFCPMHTFWIGELIFISSTTLISYLAFLLKYIEDECIICLCATMIIDIEVSSVIMIIIIATFD